MEKIVYTYFATGEKIEVFFNEQTINGKKVENDKSMQYTYKNLKTKIKAIGGIDGLLKHIRECNREGDIFNGMCFNFLKNI